MWIKLVKNPTFDSKMEKHNFLFKTAMTFKQNDGTSCKLQTAVMKTALFTCSDKDVAHISFLPLQFVWDWMTQNVLYARG